jgi:hypothetical protein
MRKKIVSLVFSLMVAGAIGFLAAPLTATARPAEDETVQPAPAVAVQRFTLPATGLRDEAAMVLVGTALIGLAAAVRRAA